MHMYASHIHTHMHGIYIFIYICVYNTYTSTSTCRLIQQVGIQVANKRLSSYMDLFSGSRRRSNAPPGNMWFPASDCWHRVWGFGLGICSTDPAINGEPRHCSAARSPPKASRHELLTRLLRNFGQIPQGHHSSGHMLWLFGLCMSDCAQPLSCGASACAPAMSGWNTFLGMEEGRHTQGLERETIFMWKLEDEKAFVAWTAELFGEVSLPNGCGVRSVINLS